MSENEDDLLPLSEMVKRLKDEHSELSREIRETLQQLLDELREHYGLDQPNESRIQSKSQ